MLPYFPSCHISIPPSSLHPLSKIALILAHPPPPLVRLVRTGRGKYPQSGRNLLSVRSRASMGSACGCRLGTRSHPHQPQETFSPRVQAPLARGRVQREGRRAAPLSARRRRQPHNHNRSTKNNEKNQHCTQKLVMRQYPDAAGALRPDACVLMYAMPGLPPCRMVAV